MCLFEIQKLFIEFSTAGKGMMYIKSGVSSTLNGQFKYCTTHPSYAAWVSVYLGTFRGKHEKELRENYFKNSQKKQV